MIYDPSEHPLLETHKLMIGSIVPRPIAFVSTLSKDGLENLAPFSYFNGICSNPPSIMFCPARRGYDGKTKDTLNNIRDTNEFVVNIVSEEFEGSFFISVLGLVIIKYRMLHLKLFIVSFFYQLINSSDTLSRPTFRNCLVGPIIPGINIEM